jgi:spermidine/putrescine transport system substrate-binding protein
MDEIFNKMEGGEATLAAYYAGDCLSMMENNESLGFYYPKKDGKIVTNMFADAMCIPSSSTNTELAHAYINFMLSEEAAVANAEYIYYASPNKAVLESEEYLDYMGEDFDVIYDSELEENLEYMFNTYAYRDLDDSTRKLLNSKWEELKVDSESFGGGIYIVCGVIAAAIVGFLVYCYIIKRKRRKLYWNKKA